MVEYILHLSLNDVNVIRFYYRTMLPTITVMVAYIAMICQQMASQSDIVLERSLAQLTGKVTSI